VFGFDVRQKPTLHAGGNNERGPLTPEKKGPQGVLVLKLDLREQRYQHEKKFVPGTRVWEKRLRKLRESASLRYVIRRRLGPAQTLTKFASFESGEKKRAL